MIIFAYHGVLKNIFIFTIKLWNCSNVRYFVYSKPTIVAVVVESDLFYTDFIIHLGPYSIVNVD